MREEALDLLNKARAIGEEGIGAVAEDVGGDSDIIAASASIRAWRLVQVSSSPAACRAAWCLVCTERDARLGCSEEKWGGGEDGGYR